MGYENVVPDMTGYTTPSGTVTADSEFNPSSYPAWRAFDQYDGSMWINYYWANPSMPAWLAYEFPAETEIAAFRFKNPAGSTPLQPKTFHFRGWNGSGWDVLHTETDYPFQGYSAWTETFVLSPAANYTKYDLYIETTYHGEEAVAIAELELMASLPSYDAPVVSFPFIPNAPTYIAGDFYNAPAVNLPFNSNSPSFAVGPVSLTMPVVNIPFTPNAPGLTIVPDSTIPSTIIYRCTLTGTTDIILPISSMQARYRNGEASYLSVVVPNGTDYADEITARSSGAIILERGVKFFDGTQQLVEIMRVDLEDIRDDWGGSNRSVTLVGHRTTTNTSPKTIELEGVTYLASGTGKKRLRAGMNLNLRPGDTATYGAISIVVDNIVYTADPSGETMEITEL